MSLMDVVFCQVSLQRPDPSSTKVVPSVYVCVCLCVCMFVCVYVCVCVCVVECDQVQQ